MVAIPNSFGGQKRLWVVIERGRSAERRQLSCNPSGHLTTAPRSFPTVETSRKLPELENRHSWFNKDGAQTQRGSKSLTRHSKHEPITTIVVICDRWRSSSGGSYSFKNFRLPDFRIPLVLSHHDHLQICRSHWFVVYRGLPASRLIRR